MRKNVDKDNKNYKEKINFNFSLTIISLLLFFFFFLFYFHNWANSFFIKFHFCNHTLCIFYSIIWLFFGAYNFFNFYKEKKINKKKETSEERKKHLKKCLIIFLAVLIIGIILMNIIPCDSLGKINFAFNSTHNQKDIDNKKNSFLDDDFNFSNSTWISNILNCTDTDGGLVPEIRSEIYGLADGEVTSTGNQDSCHSEILNELYCEDSNYFSIEINCKEYFESDFAYCEDGVCKLGEEINCQETCTFYGSSNFRGPFMNCSECNSDEACNIFINSGVVVYENTPIHCCCSNEANTLCEDYALANDYEYWVLTEGYCEDTANVMCGVYGFDLEEFFVKFTAEEGNCCVWNCKPLTPIPNCTDNDGDHYWIEGGGCGPVDCNDVNPDINPGAIENCDSIDNNCDGELLENENQYSTGIENCSDGFDNDCDGLIDCKDSDCYWLETCKCENAEPPDCVGLCEKGACQLNEIEKKCECVI